MFEHVDIHKVLLGQVQEQLAAFDRPGGVYEGNGIGVLDALPIKELNDSLGQQNILHTDCLYVNLLVRMGNQHFFHFKPSKLLSVE